MVSRVFIFLFLAFFFALPPSSYAANTGRAAALKYFSKKTPGGSRAPQSRISAPVMVGAPGLVSLSVGTLVSSQSYQWAGDDLSGWNAEVAYQPPGGDYFSRGYHLELQKFNDQSQEFSKLSFLFSLTFPRKISFPVYIGAALGPGFFFSQKRGESELSLDYKGFVGFRLNHERSQYFVQSGVKNHIHMLSDGQFIGWFVSSGVAYKF